MQHEQDYANAIVKPRRRRFKRLRWWLWRVIPILLVSFLSCLTYALVNRWNVTRNANREFDQVAAELDQSDPQWRWEEIEAGQATIPPEQNSALVIDKAAKLLPPDWPTRLASDPVVNNVPVPPPPGGHSPSPMESIQDLPANQIVPKDLVDKLRQEWRALAAPLAEARRLREFPRGRAPLTLAANPLDTLLPYVDQLRKIGQLLRLEILVQIEDGNADVALTSLHTIFNLERCVLDDPLIIVYLVRINEVNAAVISAERVLARGQPTQEPLNELALLLDREELEAWPSLLAGLRGERAIMACQMERLADGTITLADPPRRMNTLEHFQNWLLVRPIMAENRAPSLRSMTRLVEAARLPRPQRQQDMHAFETELQRMKNDPRRKVTWLFATAGPKIFAAHDRYVGMVRCARTAVAAEIFQRDHQRWPRNLDELVPAYLPAIPIDPYTEQPLQMVLRDDGMVVYSMGAPEDNPSEISDEQWERHWNRFAARPFFRLWNPDQRGIPAR